MKVIQKVKQFFQDICVEHDELQNLWRLQGYCIYCGKVWEPGITKQDIKNEQARIRTELQKRELRKLRALGDEILKNT